MLLADRYAESRDFARVHERALFPPQRTPSELELQARWFAGDFGRQFRSVSGDDIEVVQFGTWNRAAGPDFSDAVVRINGGDPVRGPIEFDLADRSWETHGHATNPAFDDAVLHVFRSSKRSHVFHPHEIASQCAAGASRSSGPCRTLSPPMSRWPDRAVVRRRSLICRKNGFAASSPPRRNFACNAKPRGSKTSWRITGATKRSSRRSPRRWVTRKTSWPLRFSRNGCRSTSCATRNDDAEAILFGVAGFLEAPDLAVYPDKTRGYVRKLWDRWWPHRDEMQRLVLPAKLWRLSGTRPLNHPQRRLGALATLVDAWRSLHEITHEEERENAESFFLGLRHPFWNFHYTLASDPAEKEMALVGQSRIADILANVLLPFFLAEGADIWTAYEKLPARLTNRRLETGAARLFGGDPTAFALH